MTEAILALDKTKIADQRKTWEDAISLARELPCEPGAQEEWWSQYVQEAHAALKLADEERLELKAPITKAGNDVDGAYRPLRKALEQFIELGKSKLAQAARARFHAEADAARALAEAGARDDAAAIEAAIAAVPEEQKLTGTLSKQTYAWKVVNRRAVPDTHLKVDEDFVNGQLEVALRDTGRPPEIPGIEFYLDFTVRVKPKKEKKK